MIVFLRIFYIILFFIIFMKRFKIFLNFLRLYKLKHFLEKIRSKLKFQKILYLQILNYLQNLHPIIPNNNWEILHVFFKVIKIISVICHVLFVLQLYVLQLYLTLIIFFIRVPFFSQHLWSDMLLLYIH